MTDLFLMRLFGDGFNKMKCMQIEGQISIKRPKIQLKNRTLTIEFGSVFRTFWFGSVLGRLSLVFELDFLVFCPSMQIQSEQAKYCTHS